MSDKQTLDFHITCRLSVDVSELEKHKTEQAYYDWFKGKFSYWFPKNHFAAGGEVITSILTPPKEQKETKTDPTQSELDELAEEWQACRNIFVYGTLRHDLSSEANLAGTVVGEASTFGRMFSLSWYPAVVPAENSTVSGQLVSFDDLEEKEWQELLREYDKYESVPTLYTRSLVDVWTADGTKAKAFMYFYANPKSKALSTQVPSGDWKHHVEGRKQWEDA